MFNSMLTGATSTPNTNAQPPKKKWSWVAIVVVAFVFGFCSYAVFPHVALVSGLITSDQYVTITLKFFDFCLKVVENAANVIPSILPTQK